MKKPLIKIYLLDFPKIRQAVFTALDLFGQGVKSEDDMTLVVIKVLQDS